MPGVVSRSSASQHSEEMSVLADKNLATEDCDSENDVAMSDGTAVKRQRRAQRKRRFGVELNANVLSLRGRSEESEPAMKKRRMGDGHPVKPRNANANAARQAEQAAQHQEEAEGAVDKNKESEEENEGATRGGTQEDSNSEGQQHTDADADADADTDVNVMDEDEPMGESHSQADKPEATAPANPLEQWVSEQLEKPWLSRWDRRDAADECCVVDYVDDIMGNLMKQQEARPLLGDYMARQRDISSKMRVVLLDWMTDVHRKFNMERQTLHLAVSILDRFLARKQVSRRKLQLIGCASLWVSSKYHEIYAPEVDDFVYISDNAFKRDELINAEALIAKVLDFTFTVPTPLSFVERFVKYCTFNLHHTREQDIITHMIHYCLEHCLLDYEVAVQYRPSLVAASAVCYAVCAVRLISRREQWDRIFAHRCGIPHRFEECLPIMRRIDIHCKAPSDQCRHKAIRKKYRTTAYSKVALMSFKKLDLEAFQ